MKNSMIVRTLGFWGRNAKNVSYFYIFFKRLCKKIKHVFLCMFFLF